MSKVFKESENTAPSFYFGKKNYIFMLVGLGFITLGFLLMLGYDANTRPDGTHDPNYWNETIYSVRRVRVAPLLVVLGFAVEAYSILYLPEK
ncbi:MAG: DUF3098 domain-containing protein [Bergeyella sp.]|nr:DUF3098 domain-containing protein [Bergeyella sp.]